AAGVLTVGPAGRADDPAAIVGTALAPLRAVHAGNLSRDERLQLDARITEGRRKIKDLGSTAAPALGRALEAAIAAGSTEGSLFLISAADLLDSVEPSKHRAQVISALARIDPRDPTIRSYLDPYFRFAHRLAQSYGKEAVPALLPFLRLEHAELQIVDEGS